MENVRIAILSTHDNVCAFMDNEAVDGLHYWDDELHQYLSGSSHTFTFKADARHEDSVYLTVGNKISFQYHKKDYYLNIVNCIRSEDVVEVEAYALSFELLNEYVSAYAASSAMSFEEYLDVFDYEKTVQLGINEVSDKSIKHEWTGTDTILGRLFSLANVFDAEIEFVTRLNQDYSLGAVILNIYKEHSDSEQGIGRNRTDITLRYGVEVEGVTKTSDMTDLYTAIRPTGTDGLTLKELEKTELDEDGNVEYQLRKGDGTICAVQARDRFPSNLMGKRSDGYIVYYWSYETANVNMLYGQALAQLKKNCVPQVSYDVKGYFDLEIGDTVIVCDEEYTPELYLSVRVVEQSVSFTDPSKNKTTVGNVKELQSEIDAELLARVQELASAINQADSKYATKTELGETDKKVTKVDNKVTALESVVADKVSTKELEADRARITSLEAGNVDIKNKLTANEASINSLIAKDAEIDGKLTAQDASIKKLDAEKISAEDANLTYATIESLKSTDATITNLSSDYASFKDTTTETLKAQTADIVDLKANKLSATDADLRYANIDFTNIDKAAMEYFYAQSGLIKDVTVGDQTITGELVGVTIKGDLIAGNTIVADKIVMKGSDGLYYKLNTDGATVEKEQTDYNSLKGSILQAKSVTAEKISVKDLVAFGATIGGVNIADSSIYSGVKSSVNNTTRGFYLGKDGQAAFGDSSNYLKYFQDTDGTWKLAIAADSVSLKSGTNVGDAIESLQESGGFNWNLFIETDYKKGTFTQGNKDGKSGWWNTSTLSQCLNTDDVGDLALRLLLKDWYLGQYARVEEGKEYTISCDVKLDPDATVDTFSYFQLNTDILYVTSYRFGVDITKQWKHMVLTYTCKASGFERFHLRGTSGATGIDNYFWIKNLKFEKGSVATAWTPAESEIYGKDGQNGKDGSKGDTGATGPQGATGAQGKPGIDFSQGKMLYTDPMFKNGFNGISLYDNNNSGNVKLWRATKSNDSPISGSDYEIRIQNTGTANPSLGGFYFATQSRCNAIFVYRIIAYIPSGYTINFASNTAGGVYAGEWLSSNVGDGNFREYVYRIQCGRNGQYSSTGFFYLDGTAGTTDNPVTWYIAYATCYDMTATSDVVSLSASLEVANGNISALASRTSSVEGRISTAESSIKQNADAISLKVSQSDFNALQVGGRNLLEKTNGNTSQTLTYPSSSYSDSRRWYTTVKMNDGYYTLSFWAKSTHAGDVVRVHLYSPSNVTNVIDSFGRSQGYTADGLCDFPLTTTMTKYWITYSVPKDDCARSVIIARLWSGAGSGTVTINREKLEAGMKSTDWTPAPEDQVYTGDVISQLNSELSITGNAIALTTGHFTVNATNLTITSDGTLTAKNGVFSGKLEAATGTFAGNIVASSCSVGDGSAGLNVSSGYAALQSTTGNTNAARIITSGTTATMSAWGSTSQYGAYISVEPDEIDIQANGDIHLTPVNGAVYCGSSILRPMYFTAFTQSKSLTFTANSAQNIGLSACPTAKSMGYTNVQCLGGITDNANVYVLGSGWLTNPTATSRSITKIVWYLLYY